jgi:hypothetical protein
MCGFEEESQESESRSQEAHSKRRVVIPGRHVSETIRDGIEEQ